MPDIMHLVTINAAPDYVFDALATENGIRGWWTSDANLDPRVGGKGEFRFYGGSKITIVEVTELHRPRRVGWKVLRSFRPEWESTTISFDLQTLDGGTKLRFAHLGFPRADDDYAICTTGWGLYLASLKTFLENQVVDTRSDDAK